MLGAFFTLNHLPSGDIFNSGYELVMFSLVVIFPVWWLVLRQGRPWGDLGITKKHWMASLVIGVAIFLFFLMGLWKQYSGKDIDLYAMLAFNLVGLWEPFFVYGWLQLRFDRAFGIIPGIILTGLCIGIYHIGSFPLGAVLSFVVLGCIFAALFRLTSNLLILWPLVWGASSSFSLLAAEKTIGWNDAGFMALILLIQLAFIVYARKSGKRQSSQGMIA
jgi:membrane protease YdiL (CAAX protease family)